MAKFSGCDFTDTAGTDLTAFGGGHAAGCTGHVGAGAWTALPSNTGTIVVSNANRARAGTANTLARYYKADTPADANYSVYATMRVITATDICRPGVMARCSNSADTAYVFRFNNGNWNVHRRVAGVATNLTTDVTATVSAGNDYQLELRVNGSSIQCFVDGVDVFGGALTDGNITAAGFPGLYQVAVSADNTHDLHHDSWFADDTPGGGGAASFTGTAAVTLPAIAPAASGTYTPLAITGTGAVALPAVAPAASGTNTAGITGSAAVTVHGVAAAASGGTSISGGVGRVGARGTSTVTKSTFTFSIGAVGARGYSSVGAAITGAAAITIAPVAVSGTGAEAFSGAAAVTIAVAPSGSGTNTPLAITGSAAVTLPSVHVSASANGASIGTGATALPGVAPAAVGSLTFSGAAAPSLSIAVAASGAQVFTGSAAVGLSVMVASTGTQSMAITGTGAVAIALPAPSGRQTTLGPGTVHGGARRVGGVHAGPAQAVLA